MPILFILFLLLQANSPSAGFFVWFPLMSGFAVMVGGLVLNAFIFGKAFEKKVDKTLFDEAISKRVEESIYNENNKILNNKIEMKANKEILDIYRDQMREYYKMTDKRLTDINEKQDDSCKLNAETHRKVSNSLERIEVVVYSIQKNCDKQTCKK